MKEYTITVNGTAYQVTVEEKGAQSSPVKSTAPKTPSAAPQPQAAPQPAASGRLKVVAPMPGKILAVRVSQQETVKKGQVLLVLEAMKMENEIVAPEDGTVASIMIREGETVDAGKILVTID